MVVRMWFLSGGKINCLRCMLPVVSRPLVKSLHGRKGNILTKTTTSDIFGLECCFHANFADQRSRSTIICYAEQPHAETRV